MNEVPWFYPGLVMAVVVAALGAGRVASVTGTGRVAAGLLIASIGMILAATLTPLLDTLQAGVHGAGGCDLDSLSLPPLGSLRLDDDRTLNILLFVPLGVAVALIERPRARTVAVAAAIVAPFAIETTQSLLSFLGRGCQAVDVVDNLTGLAIGLILGTIVARLGRHRGDQARRASTRSR